MRRMPVSLVLVLAAALLAACGKGGSLTVTATGAQATAPSATKAPSAKTPAPPATAKPAPGKAPGNAPGRSRALAFARAVNLTPADVPGFAASEKRNSSSSGEKRLEHQMLRCAGLSGGSAKALVRTELQGLPPQTPDHRLQRQLRSRRAVERRTGPEGPGGDPQRARARLLLALSAADLQGRARQGRHGRPGDDPVRHATRAGRQRQLRLARHRLVQRARHQAADLPGLPRLRRRPQRGHAAQLRAAAPLSGVGPAALFALLLARARSHAP